MFTGPSAAFVTAFEFPAHRVDHLQQLCRHLLQSGYDHSPRISGCCLAVVFQFRHRRAISLANFSGILRMFFGDRIVIFVWITIVRSCQNTPMSFGRVWPTHSVLLRTKTILTFAATTTVLSKPPAALLLMISRAWARPRPPWASTCASGRTSFEREYYLRKVTEPPIIVTPSAHCNY